MVGDRADAMLGVMDEAMDEARHEGKYRRIEVITGRRQRRNWTDEEKAQILAESAEPDVNISAVARRWGVNRGLLNVWRREAGLTSRRSAQAGAQQAMRTAAKNILYVVANSRQYDPANLTTGIPKWKLIMYAADVVLGLLLFLLFVKIVGNFRKRRKGWMD